MAKYLIFAVINIEFLTILIFVEKSNETYFFHEFII